MAWAKSCTKIRRCRTSASPASGILLRPGFIFTVEPMVNAGSYETVLDKKDGWTVRTADGSLSAQFEHSIVITDNGPEIHDAAVDVQALRGLPPRAPPLLPP